MVLGGRHAFLTRDAIIQEIGNALMDWLLSVCLSDGIEAPARSDSLSWVQRVTDAAAFKEREEIMGLVCDEWESKSGREVLVFCWGSVCS